MKKVIESVVGFKDDVVDFVKESSVNEIKIALMVNTILVIVLAFIADNTYEVFKSAGVAWLIILVVCTLLLKFTNRETVKKRHDKMYKWISAKCDKVLSYFTIRENILYLGLWIITFAMIFAKVTFFEVMLLLLINSIVIISICISLKNSWSIMPFLKNKFNELSYIHHSSAIGGSIGMYLFMNSFFGKNLSIIDLSLMIFGGYLTMFIVLFIGKNMKNKEIKEI